MNQIDDLLREFRSDQPGPKAGAAARIAAQAGAGRLRRVPRWRRKQVLAPALGGVAFTAAALALAFGLPGGGGSSNALASVSKALTPSEGVLHNVYKVTYETRTGSGSFRVDEVVHMHEFTGFDAGTANRVRLFISSGQLDRPPTDEDSVIAVDAAGKLSARSWVDGRIRTETAGLTSLDGVSTAGRLRAALREGSVRVVSTSGSTIVLRGAPTAAGSAAGCEAAFGDIVVDASTFRPVSMIENMGCDGDPTTVTSRQVIRVEQSETLPDTPANRKLLELGDWPIGEGVALG